MSPKIIAPDLVVSENKKNVFVEYKVNMQQWESMYTSSHGLDSLLVYVVPMVEQYTV